MSFEYQHVDLGDTIGVLQIGSLFGVFLFGIVTLQTYNYYRAYGDDKWFNKTLIAIIWICEIGHTFCISYDVYRVTITFYGKPEFLGRFQGIAASTIFGALITLLAQGFYSMRILRLLPKPYNHIGTFCLVVSLVRMGVSIYLTNVGTSAKDIAEYKLRGKTLVTVVFVMGAVTDVMIASSMIYYLLQKRVQAGMERSTRLIDRLLTYTLPHNASFKLKDRAFLQAVVVVICFRTMPHNLIWLAIYTFVAKLYSSSLLSALNARKELREDNQTSVINFPSAWGRTTSRFISSHQVEGPAQNDIALRLEERDPNHYGPRTPFYIKRELTQNEPSVLLPDM